MIGRNHTPGMITTLNQLAALASGRCGPGRQLQQQGSAFSRAFGDSMHTARAVWCGPVRSKRIDVPSQMGVRGKTAGSPPLRAPIPRAFRPGVRRSLHRWRSTGKTGQIRGAPTSLPPAIVGGGARQRPPPTVSPLAAPPQADIAGSAVLLIKLAALQRALGVQTPFDPLLPSGHGTERILGDAETDFRVIGMDPASLRKRVQVSSAGGPRGSDACRTGWRQRCRQRQRATKAKAGGRGTGRGNLARSANGSNL
jgi:hypothetical protein